MVFKMEEQVETTNLTNKKSTTPSNYESLGAAMAAELMIGLWFGTGAILAVKMMNSLDYCIKELISLY